MHCTLIPIATSVSCSGSHCNQILLPQWHGCAIATSVSCSGSHCNQTLLPQWHGCALLLQCLVVNPTATKSSCHSGMGVPLLLQCLVVNPTATKSSCHSGMGVPLLLLSTRGACVNVVHHKYIPLMPSSCEVSGAWFSSSDAHTLRRHSISSVACVNCRGKMHIHSCNRPTTL